MGAVTTEGISILINASGGGVRDTEGILILIKESGWGVSWQQKLF